MQITPQAKNSEESKILSEIASMGAGDRGAVEDIMFVTGGVYASARGLNCKPVFIDNRSDGTRMNRVACVMGENWFFVTNVFEVEDAAVENDLMNADASVLK